MPNGPAEPPLEEPLSRENSDTQNSPNFVLSKEDFSTTRKDSEDFVSNLCVPSVTATFDGTEVALGRKVKPIDGSLDAMAETLDNGVGEDEGAIEIVDGSDSAEPKLLGVAVTEGDWLPAITVGATDVTEPSFVESKELEIVGDRVPSAEGT